MIEKVAVVALMVVCAYLNALFLSDPRKVLRDKDPIGIAILAGVLLANAGLMYWLNFDPLIALIVWLPALAGVLARKF